MFNPHAPRKEKAPFRDKQAIRDAKRAAHLSNHLREKRELERNWSAIGDTPAEVASHMDLSGSFLARLRGFN